MPPVGQQTGRTWWRSLEESAATPAGLAHLRESFPSLAATLDNGAVSRRDLLAVMAASMALGGLTACSRQPAENIAPYVRRPENMLPGNARYFASTLTLDGYARGVLVRTCDGRPVKIEGNPDHPASLGATDSIAQAEVLGLYDPDRSQSVHARGVATSYDAFAGRLAHERQRWKAGDAGLHVLAGPASSPSQQALIGALKAHYAGTRCYRHAPLSRGNIQSGTRLAFGETLEPRYDLARADVILNLDADTFGDGPAKLVHARHAMARRGGTIPAGRHNRIYTVESSPTITGAASDHRLLLAAADVPQLAMALAERVGVNVGTGRLPADVPAAWLDALAADLLRAGSSAAILVGELQTRETHALAHAMQATLGAIGNTVTYAPPVLSPADGNISDLAARMASGEVDALLILDVNPVYDAPPDADFEALLARVPFSVHWGQYRDETARQAEWHIPAAHPLESWGDARAWDGSASLMQPTILPLYDGLTAQQVLAMFDGRYPADARELVRDFWRDRLGADNFEDTWHAALSRGVISGTAVPPRAVKLTRDLARQIARRAPLSRLELQVRPDPALQDGRYANNGWLQELPRPVTQLTWDGAALISPQLATERGLANGQVVSLSVHGRSIEVPVWIQPGQPARSITLHAGQGREAAGRVGNGIGVNAFRLLPAGGALHLAGIKLAATDRHVALASTQQHNTMDGQDLVRETTLEWRGSVHRTAENAPRESLYAAPAAGSHAWGMSIDLSSCLGCNACITACQAENNTPVTGKAEVLRGREMHWLRVDRYYSGPVERPELRFQPVPCMHCEKAPCEYVCPVGATQHSSEGLNEMTYNRCVGTRYCSQNCPYKVRRFNWYHYTDDARALATPAAAHNPDVTVRSRGVMEKCTYCVQRINQAHVDARNEDRDIADGDVRTACQQACPVDAIRFGDINDASSAVARAKSSPLDYALLGELNTRPRTTYLAAVRNPHPSLQRGGKDEDGA